MNDITQSDRNLIEIIPPQGTIYEEIAAIQRDFVVSAYMKEIVYYRIYRIHRDKLWKQYINPDTGDNDYDSFEQFLQHALSHLNLGRQTIFGRIKLYEQLLWLGYTEAQSIQKITEKPELYKNVLNLVLDWDSKTRQPNSIRLPNLTGGTVGEAKAYLIGILDNADSFDRQLDAIDYIKEDLLLQPKIKIWCDSYSNIISVDYTMSSVDDNGATHIDETGIIKFYPDSDIPDWVKSKLSGIRL